MAAFPGTPPGGRRVAALAAALLVTPGTLCAPLAAAAQGRPVLAAPPGPPAALAVELKPETAAAFNRYVILREEQLDAKLRRITPCEDSPGGGECGNAGPSLWVDTLAERERAAAYRRLRAGEVVVERLKVLDDNRREIDCPAGMIHHWMGTVFIPGATLERAIALVQDYDRHHLHYAPEVLASRRLSRQGDLFRIHMRFIKKKVITVVVDTWQDVRYISLGPGRVHSRAVATRIQEVENHGKPGERLKPEGQDGGFLWRLNTYWMFEERDGGVYVQCEAITLTRNVPFLLGWIRGFITSVPRESLAFTLGTTRDLLLAPRPAGKPR